MKTRPNAFTLIELLAVVLVIALLAALTLGTAKYASRRMNNSQTQALIAKLESGIEAFKLDNGYYPTSSIYRISPVDFHAEKANSAALYSQLTSPKKYLTFRERELGNDSVAGLFILDAWETPLNYYRPLSNLSQQVFSMSTNYGIGYVPVTNYYIAGLDNYTVGGLVNQSTYDLFSYGPDQKTFVPGSVWPGSDWNIPNSVNDDIGNFKP